MFMPSVFSRIQAGFHPLEMQQYHHIYPNTIKSENPQQNIKQGLFCRNLSVTYPEHWFDGLSSPHQR